jgi:hypothetical protein
MLSSKNSIRAGLTSATGGAAPHHQERSLAYTGLAVEEERPGRAFRAAGRRSFRSVDTRQTIRERPRRDFNRVTRLTAAARRAAAVSEGRDAGDCLTVSRQVIRSY